MGDFQCFTLKFKGISRVLYTPLAISLPFDGVHKVPLFQTHCIWDTGCSKTTITQEVVDALGLIPTGFDITNTASERGKKVSTYQIDLYLSNDLVFRGLTVNHGMIVDGVGCLLGMDIIGQGDLSITSLNGNTCMSFRHPSAHEIDFHKDNYFNVKSAVSNPFKDAKRNELCPCKSGKKYKHCHGKES